jgi:polyhydroxyalkanoate synthesis regulator phasin
MPDNLFEDLKDVLQEFKDFLDDKVSVIQPAVAALRAIIPDQIDNLLDKLIELLNKVKTEVQNLDVSAIPGLGDAAEFTEKVKDFIDGAKALLPDDSDDFDAVKDIADVVGSLPSIDDVKGEIISLVDAIVGHLNSLKA